jgi:DNA-binding IclR family transcriptional regulator
MKTIPDSAVPRARAGATKSQRSVQTSSTATRNAAPAAAAGSARERRQRVQSAQTGMAVLKGLARIGGRASLSGLAAYVGESPAKVHRYLASLIDEGLVAQDTASQQYLLGPQALMIGVAAMRQADPVRIAEPALVRLREQLEVTAFVAVMGNMGPTIIRFEEPGLPVTVNVRVGSVMSLLWSSTGRIFLGLLDNTHVLAQAEEELAHADASLRAQLDSADPVGALRRNVQTAQCASVKDTNLKGISAVSAPIFDHTGKLCAALTALGATGGFDASPDGPIAVALRREAAGASALLGYTASPSTGTVPRG